MYIFTNNRESTVQRKLLKEIRNKYYYSSFLASVLNSFYKNVLKLQYNRC